jgi:hypothetical protein
MNIKTLVGDLKVRDHLEDQDVDGKEVLKWRLNDTVWSCGLDSSGSGNGSVAVWYEHGKEPSGFVKEGEFLDHLSHYCCCMELVNPFKPSSTASTVNNSSFCIYEFRMILSINSINQLIFVMVKCCVFFALRTEFLNII